MRLGFSKSNSGVEDDQLLRVSSTDEFVLYRLKRCSYFLGDVAVGRIFLHGPRFTLHVHDAHGALGLEHQIHHRRVSQSRHIVDHVGAGR